MPHADQGDQHLLTCGALCRVRSQPMGAEGGAEGVKLEQQVLITDTGVQLLSPYPFEEELME